MADITNIRFTFQREEQAAAAAEIARTMIKISCAIDEKDHPAWADEAARAETLTQAYLALGGQTASYDPTVNYPYCSIQRVRQEGRELFIDRCGDLVRGFLITSKRGLFPQLCAACALHDPDSLFDAVCQYEMTVSGYVCLTEMHFDGRQFRAAERYADDACDEGEWAGESTGTYAVDPDGTLRKRS